MATVQHGKTGRVERKKQKNPRFLLPRHLLEPAVLNCFEAHGYPDSAIQHMKAALSTSSVLLRPTDGGKSLEVTRLAVQRFKHTTSFLDNAEDEAVDEDSLDGGVSLRYVPPAEDAFDDDLTSCSALSKVKLRTKSGTTASSLSWKPRRNRLGNLFAILSPPAEKEHARMLLDSGCDVNLIAGRMLPFLNLKEGDVEDCLLEMKPLSGIVESHELVHVSFEFEGWNHEYKAGFFVLSDDYMTFDAILGHQFLNKHRLYPRDGILPDVMKAQAAALHRDDQGVSIDPTSPQLHG